MLAPPEFLFKGSKIGHKIREKAEIIVILSRKHLKHLVTLFFCSPHSPLTPYSTALAPPPPYQSNQNRSHFWKKNLDFVVQVQYKMDKIIKIFVSL